MNPKHIVITVYGSLGDLHPLMALGMGLQERGHRVTLATSAYYRTKVEAEGLGFSVLRPEPAFEDPENFMAKLLAPQSGPEFLMRELLFPYLGDTCADLRPVLETADFLVNSPLVFPGPLLAERMKLPWAAVALQPMLFFSTTDPPILPIAPRFTQWVHRFCPGLSRFLIPWAKSLTQGWVGPVHELRESLNVPDRGNPIFEGQFSPTLNLALFSKLLGTAQPDWPLNTHRTGFAFYDRMHPAESSNINELPEPVQAFLAEGPPPVVFTLGSSAVMHAGDFYAMSMEAVTTLGCRAMMVAGEAALNLPSTPNILVWDALPYSRLFPHAAAVVHQGGVGTTAQVLRAGKPMLVVPFAFDQPDNAARIQTLGAGLSLPRKQYHSQPAAQALHRLLTEGNFSRKAQDTSRIIALEDGVTNACNAIEAVLTVGNSPDIPTGG